MDRLEPVDPARQASGSTRRSELARELQPRVIRRAADETEGEVVGVLPGHLADQGPVLASLAARVRMPSAKVDLPAMFIGGLPGPVAVQVNVAVVLDRQGDLRVLGRRGGPGPGQLPLDGRRGGRGRLGGRRRVAAGGLELRR